MVTQQVVTTQSKTATWSTWHTVGLVGILAGVGVDELLMPLDVRLWAWLGAVALLMLFAAIAGHGVTGCWHGALIDERNKISLSRLQATLWTLLVLSALLSAAFTNMRDGQADPLAIVMPGGLWILMGISATSLVGAPLVLSGKKNRSADDEQTRRTLDLLAKHNVNIDTVSTMGQVIVNGSPQNARWADLFRGEEIGNAAQFDLGKMQLCYFTMILVLVYAAALGILFTGPVRVISTFPDMDTSILTLLGISHAAYLANKAIPHSAS